MWKIAKLSTQVVLYQPKLDAYCYIWLRIKILKTLWLIVLFFTSKTGFKSDSHIEIVILKDACCNISLNAHFSTHCETQSQMIKLQLKLWLVYHKCNWIINSDVSLEIETLNGRKIRKLNEIYLEGEVWM